MISNTTTNVKNVAKHVKTLQISELSKGLVPFIIILLSVLRLIKINDAITECHVASRF